MPYGQVNPYARLDDAIAYYGLIGLEKDEAEVRRAAKERGLDVEQLSARVDQVRAAARRLVQARIDYVEKTRPEFEILRGVADADAGYADRRGNSEMDIFHIANRVTGSR